MHYQWVDTTEEPVQHPKCCNADTIILHCIEMHMLIIKYIWNFKWKDVSQEGMTCLFHIFLKLNSLICRGLISSDHLFTFLVTNTSFVVFDYVLKWVEEVALPNNEGKTVTKFLKRYILKRLGTPRDIISNGGSHFINLLFEKLVSNYVVK